VSDSGMPLFPEIIHATSPSRLTGERLQLKLRKLGHLLRKTQFELTEVRNQFTELYEHTPVGFLTVDHNGVIDELNLTAAALLGEPREHLRHRSLTGFIAEESLDHWLRHFHALITHDSMNSCELVLKRNQDHHFHARLDCLRLYKTSNPAMVRIVLTDITARKLAELTLQEKLDELQRWHDVTLGRETRLLELKREVNELLVAGGKPPRYTSVVTVNDNDCHSHANTPPQR
jgi:PAS domain S-box-containing protein